MPEKPKRYANVFCFSKFDGTILDSQYMGIEIYQTKEAAIKVGEKLPHWQGVVRVLEPIKPNRRNRT